MAPKNTLEDIKRYWELAGREFPIDSRVRPTTRDPYLGQLEEENILYYLKNWHDVLEVGCGDGSHTIKYSKRVKTLSAIDLADSLISVARGRIERQEITNIGLRVGSVLALRVHYKMEQFDCVISQRCLINLETWRYQKEAILQVHKVLKKGGLFLLSEGFQDGLDKINGERLKLGLDVINVVDFNRNMKCKEFDSWISHYFDIVDIRDYGTYLFFSRVFHPLAVLPATPKHDSRVNEAAMEIARGIQISELKQYSYNLFYALRKR